MFPAERVLEGPQWEALWASVCVPRILQMLVTAQAWNDARKYVPYCKGSTNCVPKWVRSVAAGEGRAGGGVSQEVGDARIGA